MTLEELCDSSVDELLKISDDELKKHFEQFLNVTRPERQTRTPTVTKPIPKYVSPAKQKMLDLLKAEGVDFSYYKKKKK